MAFEFGDIFGALTGQQAIPQATILNTGDAYNQGLAASMAGIPALNSYNNALAQGQVATGLGVQNSIYGPDANALQRGAISSVLGNLNLGTNLSPELTADITRKLSETGSMSGFGYSPAGIGNIALQTGLEANALGRQRQSDALNAIRGLPMSSFEYQNDRGLTPLQGMEDVSSVQAAQDQLANIQEQARAENFSALLNTGTKILGGIGGGFLGAAMGNPVGGALGGAAAGSTVFGRAGNQGQSLGMLAGLFGNMGRGGNSGYRVPMGESAGFPTTQGQTSFTDMSSFNFGR